jgi:hypothetical protein
VSSTEFPRPKPCDGFFTSTWNPDQQSCAWLEHVQTHGQRNLKQEGRYIWAFDPDPAITLFVIDSLDDYRDLANEYPHRYENERDPRCAPDWHTIYTTNPRPFEAVHVTAGAAVELEGWDVESTAWFALGRFTDPQRVGAG